MAPSVFISILVVAWALCIFMHATNMVIALDFEAKALQESEWWSSYSNDTSNHCEWRGIKCNEGGSVTKIDMTGFNLGDKFKKFNFSSFPNLVMLYLYNTGLQGSIPQEIGNLSKLMYLNLAWNKLTGNLPLSLANLTHLVEFYISSNLITGTIPKELGNLKDLFELDLSNNKFVGPIPSALGLLTNLSHLDLSFNEISGSIVSEIGMLKKLLVLKLEHNKLTGPIPSSLGHLTSLTKLCLNSNQINSSIPLEIGNMKNLKLLSLKDNKLIGPIPSSLGHLTNLTELDLHSNQINSSIPPEIGNMKNLSYLYLSNNRITGKIPSTICYSNQLSKLILDWNQISGSIPIEIANCHSLNTLTLSHNYLTQTIPSQIGGPCSIHWIDLSYNNLTGKIPPFLKKLYVNLSYNSLEGQIPDVFKNYSYDTLIGNKGLCGDIKSFPPCLSSSPNKNTSVDYKIKILVPLSFFLVLSLLGYFFIYQCGVRKIESESKETKNGDIFSIWNYDGKIAYEDIIKATEDFDIRYCIGIGSYGRIYKAQLPSGKVVALKKFHHLEIEELSFDKCFKNEVRMLTEIRHRNIVKLYGYCLHKRCMFLVFEYMERGSLFCVLSNNVEAVELDWIKRMNVIKSIAHALSYMHHECVPVIVHRDINSNNILLNFELEASISDFGTAKLLDPNSSNQTLIAGTYGYIAPGELYIIFVIILDIILNFLSHVELSI